MRKKFSLIVLLFSLLFVLVGCSDEDILKTEGIVYMKEHLESEDIKVQESVNGKKYLYNYSYPERYILYVKYKELYTKEELYNTYAFYVSQDIYDKTDIGATYLYNSEKDALSCDYIKTSIDNVEEEK